MKLRDKIIIQELVQTPDGQGGFEDKWQDKITVWANIKPLRGREFFQAQQIQSEVTHKMTIRYTTKIDETNRVVYNNRVFDIKSPPIDIDNRHRFLELLCIGGELLGE